MAEAPNPAGSLGKPLRKFPVEHVESTMKSNRALPKNEGDAGSPTARRRFVPQLEETSTMSSRRGDKKTSPTKGTQSAPSTPSAETSQRPRARFAPQLIETTTRSRRRGDSNPAHKLTDKTDLSPGDRIHLPRHMRLEKPERPSAFPIPPENTPVGSTNQVPQQIEESRFSSSNLSKNNITRKTSFRTPRLEPINSLPESDESSNVPSLSTSPSADDSEPFKLNKRSLRLRESCDDRFSGYLLALAARVAERQLKEQAMAAYPNETMHEPVDHFAVDRESDESDEEVRCGMLEDHQITATKDRRESAAGWDFSEMWQHQAKLEQQKKEQKDAAIGKEPTFVKPPFTSPVTAGFAGGVSRNILSQNIGAKNKEHTELRQMRSAASPPMLGGDICFPKCPSPKQTRIDPTQKPRSRHTSQTPDVPVSRNNSGLWTPVGGSPINTRKNSDIGLWNGVCIAEETDNDHLSIPGRLLQTGLMTPAPRTPAIEKGDPFAMLGNKHQLPSSPPEHEIRISGIDDVLDAESSLEDKFPDAFITQVYNYLSLGYPSLARRYDAELSKISRIPVEEIRRTDARMNTNGYVDAPEGDGAAEREVRESCGRWRALRLYVREWGRQESRMAGGQNGLWGDSGHLARKGSWGI